MMQTRACPNDSQLDSQLDNTFLGGDTIEESYWTDLPDLDEDSSSQHLSGTLLNTDLSDFAFSSLCPSPIASCGLHDNMFASEQLKDIMFQNDSPDVASVLAGTSSSMATTPDKPFQSGKSSGPLHPISNMQQSYLRRSVTPVSRMIEQTSMAEHGWSSSDVVSSA